MFRWLRRLFGFNGSQVDATYGYTPENPILCHLPPGEREVLDALRCPQGHSFEYSRVSMQGRCPDPASHLDLPGQSGMLPMCIVDRYDLRCQGGEHCCTLYFDMYHPNARNQPAPRGLAKR